MTNVSLYQISTQMNDLLEEVASLAGEMTPEIEEKIALVNKQIIEKTDDVVSWVNSREDLIALANTRIADLNDFINGVQKGLDQFDNYVNNCMVTLGVPKIEGKLYTIARRKPSQVVTIFDEKLIPMDFIKIPPPPAPSVMKAEIAVALKAGKEVPGAKLTESTNVSISYKAKKK